MRSIHVRALLCAAALGLSACGKPELSQQAGMAGPATETRPSAAPAPPEAGMSRQRVAPDEPALQRHIAVRHDVQLVTEPQQVEAAWRSANDACAAAGCEILSSALQRDDEHRPAVASLEARVPPERFEAFLKQVTSLGSVGQHQKTAEDKTDEVVDVEARIRNMTEFRDNLRRLMATPGAKLKDLVELERELVRVQSDLDSLASRRKALAHQTQKVHVTIQFSARQTVLQQGTWSPVRRAFADAGQVFAASLSALIAFVVAALPWFIGAAIVWIGIRPSWRRWRTRRAATLLQTG